MQTMVATKHHHSFGVFLVQAISNYIKPCVHATYNKKTIKCYKTCYKGRLIEGNIAEWFE